jgi:hypothetical protein
MTPVGPHLERTAKLPSEGRDEALPKAGSCGSRGGPDAVVGYGQPKSVTAPPEADGDDACAIIRKGVLDGVLDEFVHD